KTLPTENVGRLYYRQGIDGSENLLFDPSQGGSGASIAFYEVSEDGKKAMIGVAEKGSETSTIRILDVDAKTFSSESSSPCWFGIGGWTKDGAGFTYNRMNSSDVHDKSRELNTTCYYHAVGTDPSKDPVIFSAAKYPALGIKPEEIPEVGFTDDFQY